MNEYGLASLWAQSDVVGRGVALTLLLMSITSWTVIALRAWDNWQVRRMARQARRDFWHARSFAEGIAVLSHRPDENPFRQLVVEGEEAVRHHTECRSDLHGTLNISDWVTSNLKRVIDDSAQRMQSGLTLLASIGSTAPFLGLLGTVWGIYHALIGIGASGSATLDQVAGPVGEALIMTAFGLFVAIPAVLGYNALVRSNKLLLSQINRFAHELHAYFVAGARVAARDGMPARLATVVSPAAGGR
ncbi:MAG: MotA/TolQ/ExbB proton channel family protein [Gammaproteobacteria bacterium]